MLIQVVPGGNARAKVVWLNKTAISQSPRFHWDLRRADLDTWNEGPTIVAPEVGPGLQGELDVYCPVPSNWAGATIDAKLMVTNLEGAQWQQDEVYQAEARAISWPWLAGGLAIGVGVLVARRKK